MVGRLEAPRSGHDNLNTVYCDHQIYSSDNIAFYGTRYSRRQYFPIGILNPRYFDFTFGKDGKMVDADAALLAASSSSSAPKWLPFERQIVGDLYAQDGVLVLARGLGLSRLFACFARLYCGSPQALVLCLNATEQAAVLHAQLLALGVDRAFLPKVIDARSHLAERLTLYKGGGCFLVTSRILVVDFLTGQLDASQVSGLLVNDAHRVTETSVEAFILRLYRERNRDGFVKGFSDDSGALASGFNKMELVLKHLYVREALLYPRFHVEVDKCLSAREPDVYEIEVPFSPSMRTMQEALLVALEATIKELQRSTKALDASELTMERALLKSFGSSIRRQLDPLWHKLQAKTKQLVGDLTTLRQLLTYLPRYDAITYYCFLVNHETMSGQQRFPSPWLFTEAADRLFTAAKERLYRVVDKKTRAPINLRRLGGSNGTSAALKAYTVKNVELELVLERNPKWEALAQTLDEVYEEMQKKETTAQFAGGANVLVMVKDERTCAQLREFLSLGDRDMMQRRFGHFLLQKEAALKKKATAVSSLGIEQTLLLDAAAKYRANTLDFEAAQPLNVSRQTRQHGGRGGNANAAGKRKQEAAAGEHLQFFSKNGDSSSTFGLSMDELELIASSQDARAASPPPSRKAQRVGRGSDSASSVRNSSTKATPTRNLSLTVADPLEHVVLSTYDQANDHGGGGASALLRDLMPSCVVLYDPDMAFIRELEVFHATHHDEGQSLEVYFMQYDESAEQQTYLSEIRREKRAFDALIHQKAHLMMPANVYDVPFHVKMQQQQQQNARFQYSMDTRTSDRKAAGVTGVKVVVDVREFRSALPSMLHREAMVVQPVTLEVGDYILTPEICVERKSISDLFGSLNSGRLFNQAENMKRFYKLPVLLIEFAPGKAFSLLDPSEIGSEISASSIISKLSLLILHFPALRILWSRSPHATVDLFKAIKKNQDEPDVDAAVAIGNGNPITANGGGDHGETGSEQQGAGRSTGESTAASYYNTNAIDVLKKLPGINEHNYRKVLAKVESLAELSSMGQDELAQLVGKANGKKLHAFFNTSI